MSDPIESPTLPAAAAGCAEGCVYASNTGGGVPLWVPICMVCRRINWDDIAEQLAARDAQRDQDRRAVERSDLPPRLWGDGPCQDCGGTNIVWFADNVLWNRVMGGPDARSDPGGIVCIPCFVRRVDEAGLAPTGWRLIPEWHWETTTERAARRGEVNP